MRRAAALVTGVIVLLSTSALAQTPPPRSVLRVTGSGGQQAVLTVPPGGMRVDYPFFTTPRLDGPDGTVSGVVIQKLPGRRLVGGIVLQNVPGFDGAIEQGLLAFDGLDLDPGRYAVTLLGAGRQDVALDLPERPSMTLKARGPSRPITRTTFRAASIAHTWSDAVHVPPTSSIVILGSGGGGEHQQATHDQSCFRPADEDDGVCLPPDSASTSGSPGAGAAASWGSLTFTTGPEQAGEYVHSGRVAAAGPTSTAAHSHVIVMLPR